jgi:predicted HAD superfamily phosphohydrolase YqeG
MTTFLELDEASLVGATLVVDVDGTLVPDKQAMLRSSVEEKLRSLSKESTIFLCSNGSPRSAEAFASQTGVRSFRARKPLLGSSRAHIGTPSRCVVIGDKYLTDGIFAGALGAEFIKVSHLRAPTDGLFARTSYVIDDIAWRASPAITALRPWHWIKNLLIFAPLFFAVQAFDLTRLTQSVEAFLAFSFAASAMYIVNDIADVARDRMHPRKRFRPLASGRLSITQAYVLLACVSAAAMIALIPIVSVAPVLLAYVVLNVLYSVRLKHIAVAFSNQDLGITPSICAGVLKSIPMCNRSPL